MSRARREQENLTDRSPAEPPPLLTTHEGLGRQTFWDGRDKPGLKAAQAFVLSGAVAQPAVLGSLAEQLCLQREDVVEDAIDAPAFETMLREHASSLEVAPQGRPQRPVDASLASHLRLLEQLQAPIKRKLPHPVFPDPHLRLCQGPRPVQRW
jgi:hypothetical protein